MRFALPEGKRRTLAPYRNKLVDMGIRPEHIKVQGSGLREKKNLVKGEVSLIELMGNEKIFHFTVGKDTMICRSNSDCMVEKGKKCSFVFDTKFSHFFDVDTGKNVHHLS